MSFWLILFAILVLFSVGGIIYLISRFHRFSFIEKLAGKHKKLSWFLSILPVAVIGTASYYLINLWSMIVIMIHLFVIWLICDIIASLLRRMNGWERYRNIEGIAAIVITVIYLTYGWIMAHKIFITNYEFSTAKPIGSDLRIVEIADSHLGITLDGDKFAQQMERVSAQKPDIVIVAGDFVDDDSKRDDMKKACAALGGIDAEYGVFFSLGNHDKGYSQGYRNFTAAELKTELKNNGVTILEDESVLIDSKFYVIGRKDRSDDERAEIAEITADIDPSKYSIVIDHQPNDYIAEAESGVDLVLSGHTHGGHLFPAGQIGLLIGANDRVYGSEVRSNTTFVVSSGISGWAMPFKTGTKSEIVVIDIKQK